MSVIPAGAGLHEDASDDYDGHYGASSSSCHLAANLAGLTDIHLQTARFVQLNRPACVQKVVTLRAWAGWSAMARFYSRAMKFDVRIVHPNLTQSVRPLEEAGAEGKKECTSCKKERYIIDLRRCITCEKDFDEWDVSVCTTCAVDSHNGHLMSRALTRRERREAAKVDLAGLKAKLVIGLEDFKSRCEKIKVIQQKWVEDSKAALDEAAMYESLLNTCNDDAPPRLMHAMVAVVERLTNQLFEDATNGLVLEPGWNIKCTQHQAEPALATGPRANVLQQMAAVTRCLHCGQDQSVAVDVPEAGTTDEGDRPPYRTFTLAATPAGGCVYRPRVTGFGRRRPAAADDTCTAATVRRTSSTAPRGRREPSGASQADVSAATTTDEGGRPTHRTSISAVGTPADVYHPRVGDFGTRRPAPANDTRAAATAGPPPMASRPHHEPADTSQDDVSQQAAVGRGGRRPTPSTGARSATAEHDWWFNDHGYGAHQPSPDNVALAAIAAADPMFHYPDIASFATRRPTMRSGTRAAAAAGRSRVMPSVPRVSDDPQRPSNIFTNSGFPSASRGSPSPSEMAGADFVELLEARTREPPRSASTRQLSDAEDSIVLYQDLDSSSNLFEVPSSPEPPRHRPRGRQFVNSSMSSGGRGQRGTGFRGTRTR